MLMLQYDLTCSRYANYYYDKGVQKRDLIKAYGILFVLKVTGQAGKFSVVPLLLNVGSGLGLLAVVSIALESRPSSIGIVKSW